VTLNVKTLVLILIGLLLVWWVYLTRHAIVAHRRRTELAARWTPEDEKDYRKLEEHRNRISINGGFLTRLLGYVLMSPFLFLFLPLLIAEWLVKDPFENHDHTSEGMPIDSQ
jgi:hypothetical protein